MDDLLARSVGSLDYGSIGRVEIRLDDVVHHCPTPVIREDVRRVVGADNCGFEFRATLSKPNPFLEISAGTREAEGALIYAGELVAP